MPYVAKSDYRQESRGSLPLFGALSNHLKCFRSRLISFKFLNTSEPEHKSRDFYSSLLRYEKMNCDTSFSSINWQYLPLLNALNRRELEWLKPWPTLFLIMSSPVFYWRHLPIDEGTKRISCCVTTYERWTCGTKERKHHIYDVFWMSC